MHKKLTGFAAAGMMLGMLAVGTASAAPIPANLDIDFRSSAWSGANGLNLFTVGGVTASINNPSIRNLSQSTNAQGGGLSIDTLGPFDESDEIDGGERLTISFATARELTGAWITNLFPPHDGFLGLGEFVKYSINGGATQIAGPSDQADGGFFLNFGPQTVSTISFENLSALAIGNDYSVAGFTAVPEPASLALIGSGLMGLGLLRRRRRKDA